MILKQGGGAWEGENVHAHDRVNSHMRRDATSHSSHELRVRELRGEITRINHSLWDVRGADMQNRGGLVTRGYLR